MAFDRAKADEICERIADGGTLRTATADLGTTLPTFLRWCSADQELADHYARAMAIRAECKFDELDDVSELAVSAETAVQVAGLRLKADNIKWQIVKILPKKYGEKLALGGADDLPPIKTARPLAELTTEEIRAALEKLSP
jgi:hypothetical protein